MPPDIRRLSKLRELFLTQCNLTKLPPDIGLLSHLRVLSLWGNPLKDLPDGLGALEHLDVPALPPPRCLTHSLPQFSAEPPLPDIPPNILKQTGLKSLSIRLDAMRIPLDFRRLVRLEVFRCVASNGSDCALIDAAGLRALRCHLSELAKGHQVLVEINDQTSLDCLDCHLRMIVWEYYQHLQDATARDFNDFEFY